jgi:hypothetical protein
MLQDRDEADHKSGDEKAEAQMDEFPAQDVGRDGSFPPIAIAALLI